MASSNLPTAPSAYHTTLLTAQDCREHVHLIIGSNPLAASRVAQSLSVGAKPILIAPVESDMTPTAADSQQNQKRELHHNLANYISSGALTHLDRPFADEDLTTLGRSEVDNVVDAVFVTQHDQLLAERISALCKRKRIPVNVLDNPALCSFSLLSVHVDGPLQIGVTTNGRGCKLASRIRREVASALPKGLGAACARLGDVRRRIITEDAEARTAAGSAIAAAVNEGVDDSIDQSATFNKLVTELDVQAEAAKTRRMRWLAQVCEYWPLKKLVEITDDDVESILQAYPGFSSDNSSASPQPVLPGAVSEGGSSSTTTTSSSSNGRIGRIFLAGSGPGHPDLLTRATYKAIQSADLILADKLVPSGVLDMIPRRTPVSIARKFPGNADRAQEELLEQALEGVRAGKTVLRLKQGDPFIYGRGGEEVAFFREHGLGDRVVVLPGITSSLSAPLFAGIPATQRDVSDQVLICTGTGKKGKPPAPPEYVGSRTVVFLMALHRIGGLVKELTTRLGEADGVAEVQEGEKQRALWPLDTPCAVIERATCPDQRVMRTTLRYVEQAIEQEGSRPPGLLVVGRACEALYTPKQEGQPWVVEDGQFKDLDFEDSLGLSLDATSGVAHTGAA
ncbi:uroporphyrin-III C-methyltransferase [Neurospora crassa]|uniref:Siroheme synthase n=2 Tax=Neurospora crassa TaxID=5141 RepID=Q7SI49_NEUCR|nr:siroheme synthase [Neurospora crassa OR74A]EAA36506.3 siroheme synthase [Neurospora crassa OR74A]KHE89866.1 uroporphyrin-III C-methyltransferase [Neurospora crassa]CAE76594.1 related to siroheme synthase (Uroporphyrin-III C-methyltransferase) [Neurospora crassa]|eukprot:XP_965742.3 siroheme synthase [Neurospora crassa OR74A]